MARPFQKLMVPWSFLILICKLRLIMFKLVWLTKPEKCNVPAPRRRLRPVLNNNGALLTKKGCANKLIDYDYTLILQLN